MIDQPGKTDRRFPNDESFIKIVRDAISSKLDELGADKDDLALCGGACGGDLLFADACLARGLRLEIRIPFDEPTFLHKSVTYAGDTWLQRFYISKNNINTKLYTMPEEIGVGAQSSNAYSRNNIWQLYNALGWNADNVDFIGLWDGREGEGAGGTKHMYDQAIKYLGRVQILNINQLLKNKEG